MLTTLYLLIKYLLSNHYVLVLFQGLGTKGGEKLQKFSTLFKILYFLNPSGELKHRHDK